MVDYGAVELGTSMDVNELTKYLEKWQNKWICAYDMRHAPLYLL